MKTISISGAVAAGKTTLLNLLTQRLGQRALAHTERPENNPFIRIYYADPKRWSFHTQMAFLSLYFDDVSWQDANCDFYLFDRCLLENLVIAQYRHQAGELTDEEYAIIEKTANGISMLMPPIDKYIYLKCSVPLLVARLRERGRDYEGELGTAYAEKLKALYDTWLLSLPREKVLIVDEDKGVNLDEVVRFIEA